MSHGYQPQNLVAPKNRLYPSRKLRLPQKFSAKRVVDATPTEYEEV